MTANHNRHDLLVVSTHGHIYCLHKKTGSRLWRQDFPGKTLSPTLSGTLYQPSSSTELTLDFLFTVAKFTGGLISLFINDADQLIVAAQGKTCAMDLFTGTHRWTNDMEVSEK